jgi:hypothetical protein
MQLLRTHFKANHPYGKGASITRYKRVSAYLLAAANTACVLRGDTTTFLSKAIWLVDEPCHLSMPHQAVLHSTGFRLFRLRSTPAHLIITKMNPAPIAIVGTILVLILSIPIPPHQSRFMLDFMDAGHAPLFGIAALVLIRLAPRERKGTLREYLNVLLLALLLGILTELIQRLEGGDAEVRDIVADFLGAASFLMFYWTIQHSSSAVFRWLLRIAAFAILAAVYCPPVLSGMTILHRNRTFPVLLDFNSIWDSRLCRPDDAAFEVTLAPVGARRPLGEKMGCVIFKPVKKSFFLVNDFFPNWAGYHELEFTAYSENSKPLHLALSLYDRKRNGRHQPNCYRTVFTVNPGTNRIRISLEDIQRGSIPSPMDLSSMYRIILAPVSVNSRFAIYFDDFRLE